MLRDISDITEREGREITFPVTSEKKFVEADEKIPIQEILPFSLTVRNVAAKRLEVCGKTKAVVTMRCGRCLKEVKETVRISIDRHYPIRDEMVVDDEEDPLSGITENVLDTDEIIMDELFIGLPSKVLCSEDCKGLCPVCGTNLNEGTCDCDRTVTDIRMAKALEGILEEL